MAANSTYMKEERTKTNVLRVAWRSLDFNNDISETWTIYATSISVNPTSGTWRGGGPQTMVAH